ncbi:TPA: hypothetical protein N0F65_010670 [Lagenidium giganteum]|uniref:Transposase n=1 Tax=Lagenidium giganteum TaxID=4803 RepID=A0AAV2ZBJ6_9STRA|nr:TPA: hypothetical protein N0F65_010670 [Lagenidium giganteum]
MLSSPSTRDLTLFRRDGELYWCKLCPKSRKQQEGSGYTNLIDHLHRAHLEEYPLEFQLLQRQARGMDSFVTVTENVTSNYRWLEWVVMGGLPLNVCEKPLTVQNTSLKSISTITLKKHLLAVARAVRDDVRALLHGKRLGILFDAWTEGGMHVVGVIAVAAEQALRSASQPKSSTYGDQSWISPTSNEVERLFSKAGRIFSRDRRGMDACTLETLLFLRYNRELWDVQTVAAISSRKRRLEVDSINICNIHPGSLPGN